MINIAKIEKTRKALKISKYKMSKEIGNSKQIYYDIIKRKSTTIESLNKIAKVLNLDPRDLIL
jgi:transcriptional regulator with XRE-family HTH domain